jgi:hypothetical protein
MHAWLMRLPTHVVLHALSMRLPTHACLHACKPCCIVVGGPISLAAVIEAHNCGGRLGSCPGLVVGLSHDNAITAAHAVGLALLPLLHPHCRPHHSWRLPSPNAEATHRCTWCCHPFLVCPWFCLSPTRHCVTVTWPLVVRSV